MIVADAHLHTGTEIREEKRTPKIKALYFLYPDRINAKVSGWKGDGQKKKKKGIPNFIPCPQQHQSLDKCVRTHRGRENHKNKIHMCDFSWAESMHRKTYIQLESHRGKKGTTVA